MFVIPCKYTKNSNILNLVESIIRFHPDEKILIADSFSEDKTYQSILYNTNNKVIFTEKNSNYVDSAIWFSYEMFPNEEFFYVLHDSMFLHKSLESFKKEDFTSIMWFPVEVGVTWKKESQIEYVKKVLSEQSDFELKKIFTGLFGITFFTNRAILDKLKKRNLNNILPKNKDEMMCSEIIWGTCLEQVGVDIKKSSIIGKMGKWRNIFESEYITKYILQRT